MNRHFASYYPLSLILGTPIRPEPAPAKEIPWRPASTPGYEVRTVNGKSELRPKVLVPEPKKAPTSLLRALDAWLLAGAPVAPAPVVPLIKLVYYTDQAETSAPTEWQTQAPPEKGWREVLPFGNCGYKEGSYAYWFGDGWSMFGPPDDKGRDGDVSRPPAHALSLLRWRGPRLTGPDWPEPAQEPVKPVPTLDECVSVWWKAPGAGRGEDRKLLLEFSGGVDRISDIPPHRRAEFIERCRALGAQ